MVNTPAFGPRCEGQEDGHQHHARQRSIKQEADQGGDLEADDDHHDDPPQDPRFALAGTQQQRDEPEVDDVRQQPLQLMAEDVERDVPQSLQMGQVGDALQQEDHSERARRGRPDDVDPSRQTEVEDRRGEDDEAGAHDKVDDGVAAVAAQ